MNRVHIVIACMTAATFLNACQDTVPVEHGLLTIERDEITGAEVSVVQLLCDPGWASEPGADPHLGCPINLTTSTETPVDLYDVCAGVLPEGWFFSSGPRGMTGMTVPAGKTVEEAAAAIALPMKTKLVIHSTLTADGTGDMPITTAAACTSFIDAVKTSAFGEGPDKVFVVAYHLEAEYRTQANGFPAPVTGVAMSDPTLSVPAYYRLVEDVVAVELGIRSWSSNDIHLGVKFHQDTSRRDGTRLPAESGLAFAANTDVWRLQWFSLTPTTVPPRNEGIQERCSADPQKCYVDHLVLSRVATKPAGSVPNVTGEVFIKVMGEQDYSAGLAMLPDGVMTPLWVYANYTFQRIFWHREPDADVDALLAARGISNMKGRVLVHSDNNEFPEPAGAGASVSLD